MTTPRRPRRKAPVEHNPRKLREARLRIGMAQRVLAELVGTSQSVISEAEHGHRGLSAKVRPRVAEVLRCDPITFEPETVTA